MLGDPSVMLDLYCALQYRADLIHLQHAEYVKHFKAIPTMVNSVVKAIVSFLHLTLEIGGGM